MSYKWKPSKSAKRAFAEKMQSDNDFARAYNQRKQMKSEKRRASSSFDYDSAGGYYTPTQAQYDGATRLMYSNPTPEQENACNMVMYGYTCKEKVHHDHIHIINEYIRSGS